MWKTLKAATIINISVFILMLFVYEVNRHWNDIINIQNAKIERLELRIKKNENKIENLTKRINELDKVTVKATSYNAIEAQTDSTPNISACITEPTIGSIAVSQDLYFKGWTCGKKVHIKGKGIFIIKDVMHNRKTKQIDIVKETKEQANQFGVKYNLNAVLLTNYEKM